MKLLQVILIVAIQVIIIICVGTYSLQDIRLLNTTDNAFCVEYYLVKGTDEHIVDATIKSDSLGVQTLPAVNIEANTEVCYSDIAANTWTLYGCNGGSTSCDSSNAAVSITDIVVTDIVSTSTTSSATIIAVSITSIISSTSKHNIIYQYMYIMFTS